MKIKKCRICERPYVDYEALAIHQRECILHKQIELDNEWLLKQAKKKKQEKNYGIVSTVFKIATLTAIGFYAGVLISSISFLI